jgi:chromatin structure-remodeling complex protein RSC7
VLSLITDKVSHDSRYNSNVLHVRRENLHGVYDVHTNAVHYPKIMQPTHARWERQPPPDPKLNSTLMQGMSTLRLTNGTSEAEEDPSSVEENEITEDSKSIFAGVPSMFSRRFVIADIQYETAESDTLGFPGPDGDSQDIGTNGLLRMDDRLHPEFMSPDVLSDLPPECKDALVDAATREWAWKSKWQTEAADSGRTAPSKSYAWYP